MRINTIYIAKLIAGCTIWVSYKILCVPIINMGMQLCHGSRLVTQVGTHNLHTTYVHVATACIKISLQR